MIERRTQALVISGSQSTNASTLVVLCFCEWRLNGWVWLVRPRPSPSSEKYPLNWFHLTFRQAHHGILGGGVVGNT